MSEVLLNWFMALSAIVMTILGIAGLLFSDDADWSSLRSTVIVAFVFDLAASTVIGVCTGSILAAAVAFVAGAVIAPLMGAVCLGIGGLFIG